MTVEKPGSTKEIAQTNHNRNKQHDEPIRIPRITRNLVKAREKYNWSAIGFGFASHWWKNWREIC